MVHRNKGEVAKELGIWLGINERTEESFIGTNKGVVKCRIVNRLTEDKCWNLEFILSIKGMPWEPVPGRDNMHVPTSIDDSGNAIEEEDGERQEPIPLDEEAVERPTLRGGQDRFHVSRKAIAKYGATGGCPACVQIERQGHLPGRLGYNHNEVCRKRLTTAMKQDLAYRELMQKHGNGEIDMASEELWKEQIGKVKKAIYQIEAKIRREKQQVLDAQLDKTIAKMLRANIDVAEFYSPERVTKVAQTMGLKVGWSLDLTTQDSDGRAWNFNDKEMRNRAIRRVLIDKPLLLIGSPMCIVYSVMNAASHAIMSPEEVKARFDYAR